MSTPDDLPAAASGQPAAGDGWPAGEPDPLAERVGVLGERVDWLLEQFATQAPPPRLAPWRWQSLEAGQARTAWAELIGFVDWLVERYRLEESVPPCWYRHGALVEELSALRLAWLGAYTAGLCKPTDAAVWHDLLARVRVRVRIRDWDRQGCAGGTHRADVALPLPPGALTARADHVPADLAERSPTDADQRPRSLH